MYYRDSTELISVRGGEASGLHSTGSKTFMRVHVIYFCPRCGCQSFRPSATRIRKDSILGRLGVHPQRCYICRVRFYIFQPGILRTLVSPVSTPAAPGHKPLKTPALQSLDTDLLT